MALDLSTLPFSGSTNYKGVKVTATSSPGMTVHQAHASDTDEVEIYAVNTDSASRTLTLQWGGTTAPDDSIGPITLPANAGLIPVAKLRLTNSLVVKAFADAANVVNLFGHVNRIS